MSNPSSYGLSYPFRPCEDHPFLNVEMGPGEWVRVVTAGVYEDATGVLLRAFDDLADEQNRTKQELDRLRVEYAALEAEHRRLTEASYEQLKAAQTVIDVWRAFGHG